MVSLFISLTSLIASTQAACDGVTPPEGRCENERRVTWCEDDQQKHFDCPEDTVCAWNDMLPGFDCVLAPCSRDLEGDGTLEDIPPTGLCHDERLVWCSSGRVKELSCAESAVCGWNDGLGAYDCISDDPAVAVDAGEDADVSAEVADSSEEDTSTTPEPGNGDFAGPVQYDDVGNATPVSTTASAGCTTAATRAGSLPSVLFATMSVIFLGLVARLRYRP